MGGQINDNWYKVALDAREVLGGEATLGDIETWVRSEAKKLRAIQFPSPGDAADRIELMLAQGQEIPDELINRRGVLDELIRRQAPSGVKRTTGGAFEEERASFLAARP